MKSIDDMALKVIDRSSLAQFIEKLAYDFLDNQESWENRDIFSFLDALSAWLGSVEQLYINTGRELSRQATWSFFAEMMLAAKIYE